jgi:regulator of nonsense transcripts 1
MESFENFNDISSQYGASILDDTSSMISGYTTKTQDDSTLSLDSLSVSDQTPISLENVKLPSADEDFDGVLEDLKDEGHVDLPPHACRRVYLRLGPCSCI